MGEKINALIHAAKGEIAEILLDEAVPVLAKEMMKGTVVDIASETIGIVLPGVGKIMLSYKQKRLERNLELFIGEVVQRQDEFNARLSALESQEAEKMKSVYFGMIADYVMEEQQEEKIHLLVNGFLHLAEKKDSKEDLALMYYNTLEELTLLDLRVLKLYDHKHINDDSMDKIWSDYGIDRSESSLIVEKLARMGLIENKRDAEYNKIFDNMKDIIEYLEKEQRNPGKARLKRLSKLTSFKSNDLTKFGREFLAFFLDT